MDIVFLLSLLRRLLLKIIVHEFVVIYGLFNDVVW